MKPPIIAARSPSNASRPGLRLPLLTTAAGRAHLAFCPAEQRESLLEILRRSTNEVDKLAHNRPELDKILEETRARKVTRARSIPGGSRTRSPWPCPSCSRTQVLAAVVVRFAETAVPFKVAVERFVPKLREAAQTDPADLHRAAAAIRLTGTLHPAPMR